MFIVGKYLERYQENILDTLLDCFVFNNPGDIYLPIFILFIIYLSTFTQSFTSLFQNV